MSASAKRLGVGASDREQTVYPGPRGNAGAERMRVALLEYWTRQVRAPLQQRLRNVESRASSDVLDTGEVQAIAVAALADHAVEVVFAATLRYLCLPRRGSELHNAHVEDALQWAGRRLTLRPEAVFAALLVQGDEAIEERLAPIRSVTNSIDVANVLCAAGRLDALSRSVFMAEWRALERTQLDPDTPINAPVRRGARRRTVRAP